MKPFNQRQVRYVGIGLIVCGVLAALQLGRLLPIVGLWTLGISLYSFRRQEGRIAAAINSGMWLIGLGFLLLWHTVFFPGVLLLAGLSLLLRGNEWAVDKQIQALLAQVYNRLSCFRHTQKHSLSKGSSFSCPTGSETILKSKDSAQSQDPSTGETIRLP
jgi:hypothetical protein